MASLCERTFKRHGHLLANLFYIVSDIAVYKKRLDSSAFTPKRSLKPDFLNVMQAAQ